MQYMMGIAVNENRDGSVTVAATTCPTDSAPRFGFDRITAGTVRDRAICHVFLHAACAAAGIRAVYHRTLEKLYIRGLVTEGCPPSITLYILYPYKSVVQDIPLVPQRSHWLITAAEEFLLGNLKE